MSLTIDKPYLGLRAAYDGSSLIFLPREGFCGDVVLDAPYIGLRAAADGGDPVFLIGDQNVNPDGTLILNKPYIGLLAAADDGDMVFLVDGKKCDVPMCNDLCTRSGGTNDAPATLTVTDSELGGVSSLASLVSPFTNPQTITKSFSCPAARPLYIQTANPTRLSIACMVPPAVYGPSSDDGKWAFTMGSGEFNERVFLTSLDPFLLEIRGVFQNTGLGSVGTGTAYNASHPGQAYEIIITE